MGRNEKITGPYLDKKSKDLAKGGGSLIMEGDAKEWFGAGHNSVYAFDEKDYIIYHGYDAKDKGKPKLIIQQLEWDNNGWPKVMR